LHARIRDGAGAREKGVRLGIGAELARVTVARGVLNQNLERLLRRENPGFFFLVSTAVATTPSGETGTTKYGIPD
jgi:hypothetical protein